MRSAVFRFFSILLFLLLTSAAAALHAWDGSGFRPAPADESWTVTTRWDYRVRVDGAYLGFANRELREVYRRVGDEPAGWRVAGEARLLGATKKNGAPVAARLEGTEEVEFVLGRDGSVRDADGSYPRLRGFPSFPDADLIPGDRWEAPLEILIPGPEGENGVLTSIASYRYAGTRPYMGREAHYFDVAWAVRFRDFDPAGSDFLRGLEGSHQVSLVMDDATGGPVMARDRLSERWIWNDSRVEERDGFALIFWDGVPPLDSADVLEEFGNRFPGAGIASVGGGAADGDGGGRTESSPGMISGGTEDPIVFLPDSGLEGGTGADGIEVVETPRGVSVTLRNLHFVPDQAVILSEDRPVLDELAAILETIPERTVLVRGHTADVGRPEEEQALSEEGARAVADGLSARGIDPRRLIYEGVGAREPAASNTDEAGRRRNRRVELLILED